MLNNLPKATQSVTDKVWTGTHIFWLLTCYSFCYFIPCLWAKAKDWQQNKDPLKDWADAPGQKAR